MLWIDVTDLVEFIASGSTVSGVQRVEAQLVPLLIEGDSCAVFLDRTRGEFVELTTTEVIELLHDGVSSGVATATQSAKAAISRAATTLPSKLDERPNSVLLSLGAMWINDQLMAATRAAVSRGVRFVNYFYDLTPVLDAGHATDLRPLFERYLALLGDCSDRIPAISQSSRDDLAAYLQNQDLRVPPGVATALPSGLDPREGDTDVLNTNPSTHMEYALMVGTVEARKNHLLAFHAWEELISVYGADNVPNLICVGKIGWNSGEFQERLGATDGLDGKITLRSEGITDVELAELYRNALFTIYPSNYEGWGLPVTESLLFGTPVVTARNSSLIEAGGELACYFPTGDLDEFIRIIETEMLDPETRDGHRQRIAEEFQDPVTWLDITVLIKQEVQSAQNQERPGQATPTLENGKSYSLAAPHTAFTDRLIVGNQRPPQPWGFPIFASQEITINFVRGTSAELTVHLGSLCEAGSVVLQINNHDHTFSRGEFVSVNIGAGEGGTPVQLTLRAVDVGPSEQGFIGLTSITVEGESAMGTEESENFMVIKCEAENQALRADVEQLASELASANLELDRKSQSLLSRVMRRLNKPSE